jgi:hypothetical protein
VGIERPLDVRLTSREVMLQLFGGSLNDLTAVIIV